MSVLPPEFTINPSAVHPSQPTDSWKRSVGCDEGGIQPWVESRTAISQLVKGVRSRTPCGPLAPHPPHSPCVGRWSDVGKNFYENRGIVGVGFFIRESWGGKSCAGPLQGWRMAMCTPPPLPCASTPHAQATRGVAGGCYMSQKGCLHTGGGGCWLVSRRCELFGLFLPV